MRRNELEHSGHDRGGCAAGRGDGAGVLFRPVAGRQVIAKELENELSLWLVAAKGETVLGYVGSQTVLGEADMMNLAVGAEHRRQGIAAALVNALCAALRAENGAELLTLEVRDSNEAAIRLYAALGFTEIGRRPNYYFHPKEDARILRKDLTA